MRGPCGFHGLFMGHGLPHPNDKILKLPATASPPRAPSTPTIAAAIQFAASWIAPATPYAVAAFRGARVRCRRFWNSATR